MSCKLASSINSRLNAGPTSTREHRWTYVTCVISLVPCKGLGPFFKRQNGMFCMRLTTCLGGLHSLLQMGVISCIGNNCIWLSTQDNSRCNGVRRNHCMHKITEEDRSCTHTYQIIFRILVGFMFRFEKRQRMFQYSIYPCTRILSLL